MKTKNKIWLWVIIGIIMGLATALVQIEFSSFGATINSIGKATITSNDKDISGEVYVVDMTQNGAAQSARGTFSARTLTNLLGGEEEVTKSIEVGLEDMQQECTYDIENENKYIRNVGVAKKYNFGNFAGNTEVNEALDECKASFGVLCSSNSNAATCTVFVAAIEEETPGINDKVGYCFQESNSGNIGSIELDVLKFTSTMYVEIDGERFEKSISNAANDGSVALKNGRVHAAWQGNLDTGRECPSAGNQRILAFWDGNTWKTIDETDFNNYNVGRSDFRQCLSNILKDIGGKDINDCMSDYNKKADEAKKTKSFTASGGERAITEGRLNNGEVVIELSKNIQFPRFTLRIKADELGIFIPVGKPKIVSVSSSEFTIGSSGFIVARIKNDADVRAGFNVYADCPAPFGESDAQRITLNGNQEVTLNIPITAQTSNKASASCNVVVHDIEKPSNRDEKSVRVSAVTISVCNEGQVRCNGVHKEECTDNTWVDRGQDDECGDNPPPDTSCEIQYGKYNPARYWCGWDVFQKIGYILGGIAALLFIVVGYRFSKEQGKLNTGISTIIALILGLLVFFLVTIIWWVAVIASILGAIIFYFLPKR